MPPTPASPRRLVLGLMGGIASGKSTVARLLVERAGALRIDADALAREALDACARDGRLAETLGPWAVAKDGTPDRREIARRVFEDPALLRALERLTHPAVQARIAAAVAAHRAGEGPALLVLDVPLLLEVGLDRSCDALWFVDAPDAQRHARARDRLGLTEAEVRRREAAQTPVERKRARADVVLENRGSVEDLERSVMAAWKALGA